MKIRILDDLVFSADFVTATAQLLKGGGDLSAMEKEILRWACETYQQAIDRTSARGGYVHVGSTAKSFARLIAMSCVKKVRGGVLAADELFGEAST